MALNGWGQAGSPFHAGEQAVQERIGVRDKIEQMGRRIVRDFMPDEHRQFFEDLPFLIAGSVDRQGALWASLLIGEPGFVTSPDERRLAVTTMPFVSDPLAENLKAGAPLGLLGIELPTRRRNRANGHVSRLLPGGFEVGIEQSFGNCKQYIQARAGVMTSPASPTVEGAELSSGATALLQRTDTAFIATSSRDASDGYSEGVDVSHRGGLPGFVRVEAAGGASVLTLPDFSGNFMFNTFGNLEVNPRAGLLALDFDGGSLLSLTGTARVIWDDDPRVATFEGAERLLELRVERGLLWRDVFRGWSAPQFSPHLRGTGTWK